MINDRAEKMQRARQRRRRKQARKIGMREPASMLYQVKQLTEDAAQAFGAAVRSAAEAFTGKL
jgi:hypothetical protein